MVRWICIIHPYLQTNFIQNLDFFFSKDNILTLNDKTKQTKKKLAATKQESKIGSNILDGRFFLESSFEGV